MQSLELPDPEAQHEQKAHHVCSTTLHRVMSSCACQPASKDGLPLKAAFQGTPSLGSFGPPTSLTALPVSSPGLPTMNLAAPAAGADHAHRVCKTSAHC